MNLGVTSLNKIPNKTGLKGIPPNPSHLYEVFVPCQSTDKLYNMVEFIYNSYPKEYINMLNKHQTNPKFTVEQLVSYWARDSYDDDFSFRIHFEHEKDAAFFALAFGGK